MMNFLRKVFIFETADFKEAKRRINSVDSMKRAF